MACRGKRCSSTVFVDGPKAWLKQEETILVFIHHDLCQKNDFKLTLNVASSYLDVQIFSLHEIVSTGSSCRHPTAFAVLWTSVELKDFSCESLQCFYVEPACPPRTRRGCLPPCNPTSVSPPHHIQGMRGTRTRDPSSACEGSMWKKKVFCDLTQTGDSVTLERRALLGKPTGTDDEWSVLWGWRRTYILLTCQRFTGINRPPLFRDEHDAKEASKEKRRGGGGGRGDCKWPVLHRCAWYQLCSKSATWCRSMLVKPDPLSGHVKGLN